MRLLRFVRGWPPYNAGEVAGFPDDLAERLMAAGYAEPYATPSGEDEQYQAPGRGHGGGYEDRQLRSRRRR